MKRFVRFLAGWFVWERKSELSPTGSVSQALRETHRSKIDNFNRALAAATSLRELLRKQIEDIAARQATLTHSLERALAGRDEQRGAQVALELQNAEMEAKDLTARLDEATRNASELIALRDEAIARAQSDLEEATRLENQAANSNVPPERQ